MIVDMKGEKLLPAGRFSQETRKNANTLCMTQAIYPTIIEKL